MDPGPGNVVGGKYRLERPLARGGMGSVWVGRHLDLDAPVAVKFMDVSPDRGTLSSRSRFGREAKAAASIRSAHIVQVLDYDSTSDTPFIVMELLEGEDLGQRIAKWGHLELDEVASIVTQLSRGLMLAHEAGIVHRDLKPSNVFIARVGVEEVVKILDFGVAKEIRLDADASETTTGLVVGSPSYMSPEQARGGPVDARSDLWSVGVLVFQALTGKRPFEGKNLGDVLVRICSEELPIASKLAPHLPAEIDRFFERALSRSPDGRFQDAWALADALAAVAGPDKASTSGTNRAVALKPRDSQPSQSGKSRLVSASSSGLRPREEATASLASHDNPTVAASVNRDGTLRLPVPASDSTETVEAPRVAAHDEKTALVPPAASARAAVATPDTAPSPTDARVTDIAATLTNSDTTYRAATTTDREAPATAPPRRRALLWALLGAGLVAALLGASRTSLFSAPKRDDGPARASDTAVGAVREAPPRAGSSAAPDLRADAVPPALPSALVTASATASSGPDPRTATPRPFRPHSPTSVAVDPKFGLPTEHTH